MYQTLSFSFLFSEQWLQLLLVVTKFLFVLISIAFITILHSSDFITSSTVQIIRLHYLLHSSIVKTLTNFQESLPLWYSILKTSTTNLSLMWRPADLLLIFSFCLPRYVLYLFPKAFTDLISYDDSSIFEDLTSFFFCMWSMISFLKITDSLPMFILLTDSLIFNLRSPLAW